MTPVVKAERIGQVIADRYLLLRSIGQGGMGDIFAAEHRWTGRQVAIKLLRNDHVSRDHVSRDNRIERFLAEARAAAKLQHPNVVEVLDMGSDPASGSVYLALELLEGRTLAHVLESRTLTPSEIVEWVVPIMGALHHAHELGFVHRDVKPENIFLARTRQGIVPKLLDFGIVKERGVERTTFGHVLGSPAYMSPEQIRGHALTPASDIWSMGAVLYECLCGYQPFMGTRHAMLTQIAAGTPPTPLARLAPESPAALRDCVERTLRPDPSKRPPSMRELAREITEAAGTGSDDCSAVSEISGIRRSSQRAAVARVALGGVALATMLGLATALVWLIS